MAIQIQTGLDVSEGGLITMIYKSISGSVGNPNPYLDFIVLGSIMIIDIVVTIYAIFKIAQHKWVGAFVSGAGFFGILSAILGAWNSSQFFILFGGLLIVTGIIIASIVDSS